jgi:hypothetical protein
MGYDIQAKPRRPSWTVIHEIRSLVVRGRAVASLHREHGGGAVQVLDAAKKLDDWAVSYIPLELLAGLGNDGAIGKASLEAGSSIVSGAKVSLDGTAVFVSVRLENLSSDGIDQAGGLLAMGSGGCRRFCEKPGTDFF